MTVIRPFKAIRPSKEKAHLVVTRKFSSHNISYINKLLSENPYSFLHIFYPGYKEQKKTAKPDSIAHLTRIKNKFDDFIRRRILIQDATENFYLYRQIKENGNSYTGIIGNISLYEYTDNTIKKHEQTFPQRIKIFSNFLKTCPFHSEPAIVTYAQKPAMEDLIQKIISTLPEYDFTANDKLRHQLWVIKKKTDKKRIINTFKSIPEIYIANGHHRFASSALHANEKRKQNPHYTGKEDFNFFMCLFIPENQLKIFDYNRVVRNLGGLTKKEFFEKVRKKFTVTKKGKTGFKPVRPHHFSMYLDNCWYLLKAKEGTYHKNHPVHSLDTYILTANILSPVLGIADINNDKRVDFISGHNFMALQKAVDSGRMKVAFGLFPLTMKQIKKVADAGMTMPPKSTWTEPKLRNGLINFSIE